MSNEREELRILLREAMMAAEYWKERGETRIASKYYRRARKLSEQIKIDKVRESMYRHRVNHGNLHSLGGW